MKRKIMLAVFCVTVIGGCSSHVIHEQTYSLCASNPAVHPRISFGVGMSQLANETQCLKNGVLLTCEYLSEGEEIDDDARISCRKYAEATQLYISRRYSSLVRIPIDRMIEYKESTVCESFYINGFGQGSCSPRIEALIPFESTHNKAPQPTHKSGAAGL